MPAAFQFPYLVSKDTPAVALEVQANFDALLSWINENYVQKDDSPGFDVNLSAPLISGLDNQVVQKQYVDTAVLPTGTVIMWAGAALPDATKWEWCRGGLFSASDPKYQALHAIIGETYGSGSGDQFRMPDLRSKFPLGVQPGTFDEGDTGGSTNVPAHTHTNTVSDDTHSHTMPTHSHGDGSLAVDINHNHPAFTTDTTTDGKHNHIVTTRTVTNDGTNQVVVASPAVTTGEVAYTRPTTGSGGHSHSISVDVPALGVTSKNVTGSTASVDPGDTNTDQHSHNVTINSAGESPTNKNLPPYVTVNFIIKAES